LLLSVAVFVRLRNVLSDITGESGLRIIEAILAGERDPEQLAALSFLRPVTHQRLFEGTW